MTEITINIPDEFVEMGKAMMADKSLRSKFNDDPVGTMTEFGIKLPDDLTNEKLREYKVLDSSEQCERMDAKGPITAAALTPYTYPVTMVGVGVAACVVIATSKSSKGEE